MTGPVVTAAAFRADAVRRAGAHKVLFGSDGLFRHPAVELAKVRALHLSPDHEALVLGGNVLRLTHPARTATRSRRILQGGLR